MDMKLEVVVVPVSDADKAKDFYQGLGWRLDANFAKGDDFRVVQLTPPGSQCSIIFGTGITSAAPGSADGLQLVATDIEAARDELMSRGAEPNVEDASGDQAIHIATRAGNRAIVEALAERGSYVNEKSAYDRHSPLEIAVDREDRGTAEALLGHHACVTPAATQLAAKKKDEKMVALLAGYAGNACNRP